MADRLTSLPAIEAALWQQLAAATHDKQHAWRHPVLATIDDGMADARTVILREVDVHQKQLMTFSDDRAAKVRQLLRHPRATMVMWSPALNWQLRCRVLLSLDMTGLAATSRWARIKLTTAAQDYLARLPPGAPRSTPNNDRDDADTVPADGSLKREYFSVIIAQVLAIDWLELHREGHRRALFDDQGARWLQP